MFNMKLPPPLASSLLALACAAGAAPSAGAAAAVAPVRAPAPRGPGLALSVEAAQTAIAACAADGYQVGVTIVDSAGAVRVVLAQDGARQQAIDSSTKKAYTVISFGESSARVAQRATTDEGVAARVAADPRLRARAGGLPLTVGGEIIGAIGVGGAPGGEKDEACANRAIDQILGRLR